MVGKKGRDKLRFFKFVFDEDGSEVMYLPPMIAQQVNHLVGKETKIEDKTGARWPVTVSKVNGDLAFRRGWQKFFWDHHLKTGELLVFKYVRESHFVVRIYGKSACDRENFNDGMRRAKKRARTDPGPSVEEVPCQTSSLSSRGKSISDLDTSVASEAGRIPVPMEMEVLDLMMKLDDGSSQEEDRTIWGDLSKFEGQNVILLPDSDRCQNVSTSHIGFAEQAEIVGDGVQTGEVYTGQVEGHSEDNLTDKLAPSYSVVVEKSKEPGHDAERNIVQTTQIKSHSGQFVANKLAHSEDGHSDKLAPSSYSVVVEKAKEPGHDAERNMVQTTQIKGHSGQFVTNKLAHSEDSHSDKLAPSHSDVVEKAKEPGHEAERDVVQTTQIKGHSGQFVTNKFKKAVETRPVSSHPKSTKQAIVKGEETHTAAIDISWTASKHSEKPSENINSRKGEFDVSNVQNGNKIPQGVYEAKSRFHEISFSSSVVKDPSGKSSIKRELIEMEDEPVIFPRASCGKEPARKMKVKDEPESYDDLPQTAFDPFSVEVKSKLYLELPEELTTFRGKTQRGKTGKIVYLKDSRGRIWPLFYPDKHGVKALCLNWTNFCDGNKINLGDKCRFHFEKEAPCIVRVDVIRQSGDK